jgi:nucleoside-diphosphate-sugar epimerase
MVVAIPYEAGAISTARRRHMDGPVLLSLGHGYVAAALAASLPEGWRVIGTTRSAERAAALRKTGVESVIWDDTAAVSRAIGAADAILASQPPGPDGDPALARHRAALSGAGAGWVGYLSTTGVYGDRQGGWVDEESALDPVGARGAARVAAESDWRDTGLPLHVFRLPGIYGPGRSALDRLRSGKARRIVKEGQVFSRVHVGDIGRALAASIARPAPGRVWNLADDEPAAPQDVIAYAARLLAMPVPPDEPFDSADLSPMARSFYGESKRVSNRRMRAELVAPLYPDYRSGLRAILAENG